MKHYYGLCGILAGCLLASSVWATPTATKEENTPQKDPYLLI